MSQVFICPLGKNDIAVSGGALTGFCSMVISCTENATVARVVVVRDVVVKTAIRECFYNFNVLEGCQVLIANSYLTLVPLFFRVGCGSELYVRGPWLFRTIWCIFLGKFCGFKTISVWAGGCLRYEALSRSFLAKKMLLKIYGVLRLRFIFASADEKNSAFLWHGRSIINFPASRFSKAQNLNITCRTQKARNKKIGLYVGRDHPYKRLDLIVPLIRQNIIGVYLLVGFGEFNAVKRAAACYDVPVYDAAHKNIAEVLQLAARTGTEKIILVGHRTGNELIELYSVATHYLSVSESEGMSNSIIDALFFGLIIATLPNNGFDSSDPKSKVFVFSDFDELRGFLVD